MGIIGIGGCHTARLFNGNQTVEWVICVVGGVDIRVFHRGDVSFAVIPVLGISVIYIYLLPELARNDRMLVTPAP
ncbi:hypothetical protein ES703_98898 [subsurface metagenome]